MAVQKKTSKTSKTKEKKEINWMQVCVVGFCVLVVAMCIFSFANFQNFFRNDPTTTDNVQAQVGYPVVAQFTFKMNDADTLKAQMPMYAGATVDDNQYVTDADGNTYVIHKAEYNAISEGIVGHKPGDTFTVKGPGIEGHQAYLSKEDVEEKGLNYDDIEVGTVLSMGEEYTDEDGNTQTAAVNAIVHDKYDNLLVLQFGADTIDVTFVGYYETA